MAKKPVYRNPNLSDSEIKKINGMIGRSWKNGHRSGRKSVYASAFAMNAKTDAKYDKLKKADNDRFDKGRNISGAKWVEKDVYVGKHITFEPRDVNIKLGRWIRPGDKNYDKVRGKFQNPGGSS